MKTIKNVSIVGMGALGLMYANIIQNNCGPEAVQFVMDRDRVHKYRNEPFFINGKETNFKIIKKEKANPADLVIVAVKFTGLDSAMESIAACVGPSTVIISVLNGISSEELLAQRFGKEKIVYSVAQAMDAMKFGNELKYTREGELRLGIANGGLQENLLAVENFFKMSKVHYNVDEDIIRRMWSKFMLNVGINQTCMAFGATYSEVLNTKELREVFENSMKEVLTIANLKNIKLSEADIKFWIEIIETLSPDGTPSMGQDRINKRKSEVELFSGTVIKLARETKTEVPVNMMLYNKILEIEKEY